MDTAFHGQRSCAYPPDLSSRVGEDEVAMVCSGFAIMLDVHRRSMDMTV